MFYAQKVNSFQKINHADWDSPDEQYVTYMIN